MVWCTKLKCTEIDWFLSGLMWATDLKTGLKGSVGYALLAAHAVYDMPRV